MLLVDWLVHKMSLVSSYFLLPFRFIPLCFAAASRRGVIFLLLFCVHSFSNSIFVWIVEIKPCKSAYQQKNTKFQWYFDIKCLINLRNRDLMSINLSLSSRWYFMGKVCRVGWYLFSAGMTADWRHGALHGEFPCSIKYVVVIITVGCGTCGAGGARGGGRACIHLWPARGAKRRSRSVRRWRSRVTWRIEEGELPAPLQPTKKR